MFDTGIQRSFIIENSRMHLKLKTIRSEKIVINVFGKAETSCLKIIDVVRFKVKPRFEDELMSVETLVYPVICRDLKVELISIALKEYAHISKLTLVNF